MTPTFQLDTSGAIYHGQHGLIPGSARTVTLWRDLSPFTQGYIEALLRSLHVERREGGHGLEFRDDDGDWVLAEGPLPSDAAFSDLAPETLARIIADCEAFPSWSGRCDHSRHAGEVFHAQRQRGQWPDTWPPLTIQLCDDGKVRFA